MRMIAGWKYIFVLFCSIFFVLNLSAQHIEIEPNTTYFSIYDELPHFPGGNDSLNSFLNKNINSPEDYLDIQGTVYLNVSIDSTGKPCDIKIFRGLQSDFNKEALRVVSIMPNWIPAKINNKPVKSKIILPIRFRKE